MRRIRLLEPCVGMDAEGIAIEYAKNAELDWPAADAERLVKARKAEFVKK